MSGKSKYRQQRARNQRTGVHGQIRRRLRGEPWGKNLRGGGAPDGGRHVEHAQDQDPHPPGSYNEGTPGRHPTTFVQVIGSQCHDLQLEDDVMKAIKTNKEYVQKCTKWAQNDMYVYEHR